MEIVSKITGSALSASEFNQIPDELENLINKSGQTASSSDLTQVTKATAQYAGVGDFYATSGTANAIVLSAVAPRLAPPLLQNGLRARFIASANNTGTTTININNLGAKTLYFNGSTAGAGDIRGGFLYEVAYNASSDRYDLQTIDTSSLLNKKMITNCILSCSNIGTIAFAGPSITFLAGLKYLVPNGRNADGTLNNYEITLSADRTYTYTYNLPFITDTIFMTNDGTSILRLQTNFVFYVTDYTEVASRTGDNQIRYVYVYNNNQWYYTTDYGANWTEVYVSPLAKVIVDADNTIKNVFSCGPLQLYGSTIADHSFLSGIGMPCDKWVYLTFSNTSGFSFKAFGNGYATLWRQSTANTDFICMASTSGLSTVSVPDGALGSWMHIFLPARKGDIITVTHSGTGTVESFKFVYAEGEVH